MVRRSRTKILLAHEESSVVPTGEVRKLLSHGTLLRVIATIANFLVVFSMDTRNDKTSTEE